MPLCMVCPAATALKKKKKWNPNILTGIKTEMKVLKKKNPFSEFDFAQRLQQTCYESIWSRSIRHPSYNVLVPALRFFFFYLVQSHFVVFQPLPSHILCLWLSLDFSQTDKLISFIHTWSFFSFITMSWFFLFFPPWHPSSLPVGWP